MRSFSNGGGILTAWRGDSRELFYRTGTSWLTMELMAVDVTARGDTLDVGVPRLLSAQPATVPGHVRTQFPWAVTADGQRFLVQRRPESSTAASHLRAIEVVLNWAQGIGK